MFQTRRGGFSVTRFEMEDFTSLQIKWNSDPQQLAVKRLFLCEYLYPKKEKKNLQTSLMAAAQAMGTQVGGNYSFSSVISLYVEEEESDSDKHCGLKISDFKNITLLCLIFLNQNVYGNRFPPLHSNVWLVSTLRRLLLTEKE